MKTRRTETAKWKTRPTKRARTETMRIGVLALLFWAGAGLAWAGSREATVDGLEALVSKAQSDSIRISVHDGNGAPLRIGDEISYRFESDRAGYLTAVHVDSHGTVTLLYPRAGDGANRLGVGQTISFPGSGDDFTLDVEPPVGRDVVYAFVSDAPIQRSDLRLDEDELVVSFEAQQAPAFVERIGKWLASRGDGHYTANKISQQIDGRGELQYRSLDIVNYFGSRTRSIAPPKLDLHIQFASDSAELDDEARRNIDEFATALGDLRLRSMRFAVAGHTDDLGSSEHNIRLSRRRAESVEKYLIRSGGVDPGRLEIEAYGEAAPLMNENSPYARKMNRRVEFTLLRE